MGCATRPPRRRVDTGSHEPSVVSVHAAPLDHRAYVLFAVLTHALVGYTLAAVVGRAPTGAVVGAVVPDVDLLFAPAWSFPFVHRGLTHTPVFATAVVGAVVAWRRQSVVTLPSDRVGRLSAVAVGLGYGSHLVLDSLTASGVPWLYPVSTTGYGVDAGIHGIEYGVAIWVVAVAVLLVRRRTGRRAPPE